MHCGVCLRECQWSFARGAEVRPVIQASRGQPCPALRAIWHDKVNLAPDLRLSLSPKPGWRPGPRTPFDHRCAKRGVWHYQEIKRAPLLLRIPCFDGVDGFTIRNETDHEPLQLPGIGRLSLETIPAGAWPILLANAGETTRIYFHVFLSRLVMCWQMDEGAAKPSLQVAPPEFDALFHQAKDQCSADPVWDWIRLKR